MKYMNFNSSCAYAEIANLLGSVGIDTEDYKIAKAIDLPFLLVKNGQAYISGPMIQTSEFFNVYLKNFGYELVEYIKSKDEVVALLKNSNKNYLLGVRVTPTRKHAVISEKYVNDCFWFLNNKHRESAEADKLCWCEEDLRERLDDPIVLSYLEKTNIETIDTRKWLLDSIKNIDLLKADILEFCSNAVTKDELKFSMNTLFRPVLLDSIAMFTLINQKGLVEKVKIIQSQYLQVLKREKDKTKLEDELDVQGVIQVLADWKKLMKENIASK